MTSTDSFLAFMSTLIFFTGLISLFGYEIKIRWFKNTLITELEVAEWLAMLSLMSAFFLTLLMIAFLAFISVFILDDKDSAWNLSVALTLICVASLGFSNKGKILDKLRENKLNKEMSMIKSPEHTTDNEDGMDLLSRFSPAYVLFTLYHRLKKIKKEKFNYVMGFIAFVIYIYIGWEHIFPLNQIDISEMHQFGLWGNLLMWPLGLFSVGYLYSKFYDFRLKRIYRDVNNLVKFLRSEKKYVTVSGFGNFLVSKKIPLKDQINGEDFFLISPHLNLFGFLNAMNQIERIGAKKFLECNPPE